jgi:hypothetical protein
MEEKNVRAIFSPQLAKHLLLLGFSIVDLKQKKENPSATIFIFKNDNGLMNEVAKWTLSKKL